MNTSTPFRFYFLSGIATFLMLIFAFPATTHADDRYWVLGTGNWNDVNHWSATDGGAAGAAVPDANDVAHFNGNSGGGTVTLNAAVDVNALHLSSAFTGSLKQTTNAIKVGTGHMLVGSGRLIGGAAALSVSGSYTQTGGIVTHQDTFTLSGSLSVTDPGDLSPSTSFTSTGTTVFEGKEDQNLTQGNGAVLSLKTLTINNTGGTTADDIIVNMSGGLNLSGATTITLGNLDLDTHNTTFAADNNITIADATQATMVVDTDMTLSGNLVMGESSTATFSGSMTLTMNGQDQTLDLNAGTVPNLTVSSSSGTTLSHNCKVSTALQVDASSTLTISIYGLSATGATITNNGTITENTGRIYHTPTSFIVTDSAYSEATEITLGQTVYFSLTDTDENIDGTAADTVSITAAVGSDSETITLTETGNATGIFRASISSQDTHADGSSVTAGDNKLSASTEATLTITFADAQDGISTTDTATLADDIPTPTAETAATTSGGGGGGGGSRRSGVLTSQGISRRSQKGEVVGAEAQEEAPSRPTVSTPKSAVEATGWSDLSESHPHADAAVKLHKAGVVKGHDDGTVKIDNPLSRVEALTLLARTIGEEERAGVALPFSDISQRAWYSGPLRVAVARGFVKGFPDGSFRPENKLNVVQSLKLISIGLNLADQEEEKSSVEWYDPYVSVGKNEGLIGSRVKLDKDVTRGEFFSWLVRLLGE